VHRQAAPESTFVRLRWPLVLASVLLGPLLLGLAVGLVFTSVWPGLVMAAACALPMTRRPRRRGLAWTEEGLVVQRDAYRLLARWDDVAAVRTRRHRLLRVEELVLTGSELQPVDSRGRTSRIPDGVRRVGADLFVQVSFYDRNWRRGPIGEQLRRRGVIA
jgi:hypothetical protein